MLTLTLTLTRVLLIKMEQLCRKGKRVRRLRLKNKVPNPNPNPDPDPNIWLYFHLLSLTISISCHHSLYIISAHYKPLLLTILEKSPSQVTDPGAMLVNGYQAFGREVRESNLSHVLTCYVLDTDLHAFVRGLISSICESKSAKSSTGDLRVRVKG
jgi:hypothetical protein